MFYRFHAVVHLFQVYRHGFRICYIPLDVYTRYYRSGWDWNILSLTTLTSDCHISSLNWCEFTKTTVLIVTDLNNYFLQIKTESTLDA